MVYGQQTGAPTQPAGKISFEKIGENSVDAEGGVVEDVMEGLLVNSAGNPVHKLGIDVFWTQPQSADRGGGAVGRLLNRGRDAKNHTDVDGSAVAFAGMEDVEFAGPDNLSALYGLLRHDGNVAKGNESTPERMHADLAGLFTNPRTEDISAIAITASCFLGDFTKVTGCRVEFYDETSTSPGEREFLTQVRFAITGNASTVAGGQPNNAALVAVLVRKPNGWALRKGVKTYGHARDWRGLAPICRDAIAAV